MSQNLASTETERSRGTDSWLKCLELIFLFISYFFLVLLGLKL